LPDHDINTTVTNLFHGPFSRTTQVSWHHNNQLFQTLMLSPVGTIHPPTSWQSHWLAHSGHYRHTVGKQMNRNLRHFMPNAFPSQVNPPKLGLILALKYTTAYISKWFGININIHRKFSYCGETV